MQTQILNYRVIVEPDTRTGTEEPCYTALCPTLGVADGGDTIDDALANVQGAIEVYVQSLIEDNLPVPTDQPEKEIITTTQIQISGKFQLAL